MESNSRLKSEITSPDKPLPTAQNVPSNIPPPPETTTLRLANLIGQLLCPSPSSQSPDEIKKEITHTLSQLDPNDTQHRELFALVAKQLALIPAAAPATESSTMNTEVLLTRPMEPLVDGMPAPTNKLMMHVFGDTWGWGSGLEGEAMTTILEYTTAFVDGYSKQLVNAQAAPLRSCVGPLKAATTIAQNLAPLPAYLKNIYLARDDGRKVSERIQNACDQVITEVKNSLTLNQSVLVPFGWISAEKGESHATYLYIQKQSNGLYTVCHFNRGGGSEFNGPSTRIGTKSVGPSYVELADVEEKNLFNSRFWRGLVEVQTMSSYNFERTQYNASDIYDGLLPMLGGRPAPLNLEMQDLMSYQERSGRCAFASLTPFIRKQIGSFNEYKQFIYLMKKQVLWDYVKKHFNTLSTNLENRNILQKSLASYAETLEGLYEGGLLSHEAYTLDTVSIAQLNEMLAWLDKHTLKQKAENAPNLTTAASVSPKKLEKVVLLESEVDTGDVIGRQPIDFTKLFSAWTVKPPLADCVKKGTGALKAAFEAGAYDVVLREFRKILLALPLPSVGDISTDPWVLLAKQSDLNAESVLKDISDMHHYFFESCFRHSASPDFDPKNVTAMFKALAIQDAVIHNASPKFMNRGSLDLLPDFNELCRVLGEPENDGEVFKLTLTGIPFRERAFTMDHPNDFIELRAVYNYFKARNANHPAGPRAFERSLDEVRGSNKHNTYVATKSALVGGILADRLNPDIVLASHSLRDPQVKKKLEEELVRNDRKADLSYSTLIAEVYVRPQLLPQPFVLWQRQVMEMQNLMSGPIVKVPGSTHFSLELNLLQFIRSFPDGWKLFNNRISGLYNILESDKKLIIQNSDLGPINGTRFLADYPLISNKSLNEILIILSHRTGLTENDVLTKDKRNIDTICSNHSFSIWSVDTLTMSDSRWKELLLLGISPDLQISETVAYMRRNQIRLADRDFRTFFSVLLLEGELLERTLWQHIELKNDIIDLLYNCLKIYADQANMEACTWLLDLSRRIGIRWQSMTQGLQDESKQLPDIQQHLLTFLNNDSLRDDHNRLYQLLLADLSSHTEALTRPLAEHVVRGLLFFNRHPLPVDQHDPALHRAMRSGVEKILPELRPFIEESNGSLLNLIVSDLLGTAVNQNWSTKNYPVCVSTDGSQVDLESGRMTLKGQVATGLPLEITQLPLFKELFADTITAKPLENGWFELQARDGSLHRVRLSERESQRDKLSIQRLIGDKWFMHQPPLLPSVAPGETWWVSSDATKGFVIGSKGKTTHELQFIKSKNSDKRSFKLVSVKKLGHEELELVNLAALKPDESPALLEALLRMAPKEKILLWADATGKIALAELPQGLSFRPTKGGTQRWMCREIHGYFLNPIQFVETLEALQVTDYLLLANDRGERKVVLPDQNPIGYNGESVFAGTPKYKDDLSKSTTYHTYTLRPQAGRLEARLQGNPEANLYLASQLFTRCSIEAYQVIRGLLRQKQMRLDKPTKETVELLTRLAKIHEVTPDADPKAVALKLHAFYLQDIMCQRILRLDPAFQNPLNDPADVRFWPTLNSMLDHYVACSTHLGAYRLPPEEFAHICESLKAHKLTLSSQVMTFLEGQNFAEKYPIASSLPEPRSHEALRRALTEAPAQQPQPGADNQAGLGLREVLKSVFDPENRKAHIKREYSLTRSDNSTSFAAFFLTSLDRIQSKDQTVWEDIKDRLALTVNDSKKIIALLRAALAQLLVEKPDTLTPNLKADYEGFIRPLAEKYLASLGTGQRPIATLNVKGLNPLREIRKALGTAEKPISVGNRLIERYQVLPTEPPMPMDLDTYLQPIAPDPTAVARLKTTKDSVDTVLVHVKGGRVIRTEANRLLASSTAYYAERSKELSGPPGKTIKPERLLELQEDLSRRVAFQKERLLEKETLILSHVRLPGAELRVRKAHVTEAAAGQREHLTLDDLLFKYVRGQLKEVEVSKGYNLADALKSYLRDAFEVQKMERALAKAEEALFDTSDALTREELSQQVAAELLNQSLNVVKTRPECLVLQYWCNLIMRQDQVEAIDLMLNTGTANTVLQRMMGSGKTTVLMTLYALLVADGKRLSVLMAPEELMESMAEEIRQRFGDTFDLVLRPLELSGQVNLSLKQFQDILNLIRKARPAREVLFMGPKTLHCLYLKGLLLLRESVRTSGEERQEVLKKFNVVKSILNEFKEHASGLLDEVDLQLLCRFEVNIPIGKAHKLPPEELDLMIALYEALLLDPEVTQSLKCEFYSKNADPKASLCVEETYHKRLKETIVDALLRQLQKPRESAQGHVQSLSLFLQTLNEKDRGLVRTYLAQPKVDAQSPEHDILAKKRLVADVYVGTIKNKAIRNMLALAKEQLNNFLPNTLTRTCEEDYGYSELSHSVLAIPYSQGKPVEGSRFANAHETSDYTIQATYRLGIPRFSLQNQLQRLRNQALSELHQGKRLEETNAMKEFRALAGHWPDFHLLKLADNRHGEVDRIYERINNDHGLRSHFIRAYILPQVEFHRRKINSNSQTLVRMLSKAVGFSGTTANSATYHNSIETHPELSADAKTLFTLFEHFNPPNTEPINGAVVIKDEKAETIQECLTQQLKSGLQMRALIDSGGYLNQEDIDQVALNWQKKLNVVDGSISGIAYHNTANSLRVLEGEGEDRAVNSLATSSLRPAQRFTIYRQPFATGADIRQGPTAVAGVTVGRNVKLRDVAQAVWRMRQLGRQQRCRFIVSEDVRKVILDTLGLPPNTSLDHTHVLLFAVHNQAHEQEEDNVLSTRTKLLDVIQMHVMRVLLDANTNADEQSGLFTPEVENLFAQDTAGEAWELYGRTADVVPVKQAIDAEFERCVKQMEMAIKSSPLLAERIDIAQVQQEMKNVIKWDTLPEATLEPSNRSMNQLMQVQEQAQKQEKSQELSKAMVKTNVQATEVSEMPRKWRYYDWPVSRNPFSASSYHAPATLMKILDRTKELVAIRPPTLFTQMWSRVQRTVTWISGQTLGRIPYAKTAWESITGLATSALFKSQLTVEELMIKPPYTYPLSAFVSTNEESAKFARLFDNSLTVSFNFAAPRQLSPTDFVADPLQGIRKPVRHLLVARNSTTGAYEVAIVDQKDSEAFLHRLEENRRDNAHNLGDLKVCLYDIDLDSVIQSAADEITNDQLQSAPDFLKLLVQAKLFAGINHFPDEQSVYVEEILERVPGSSVNNLPFTPALQSD